MLLSESGNCLEGGATVGQRGCQYCRKKWHRLRKELEGVVEVASVEVAQMRLVKGHSGSGENSAVTRPEPVRWPDWGRQQWLGSRKRAAQGGKHQGQLQWLRIGRGELEVGGMGKGTQTRGQHSMAWTRGGIAGADQNWQR